jgi:uncharacterized protein
MTMPADSPARPGAVIERFLRGYTDPEGGDLASVYGPSVVVEMPFAPPGFPARTQTSGEQIGARFRAGAADRRYEKVDSVVLHETADPEVVIVEYAAHGRVLATGEPFAMSCINVMTVRDGRIVHSRDYTNPIAAARVLGILPEMLERLSASGGS